jgi:hypothetical protein
MLLAEQGSTPSTPEPQAYVSTNNAAAGLPSSALL